MEYFESIVDKVSSLLKSNQNFSGVRIITEYPSAPKENPLQKTTVSIGIDEIKIAGAALGDCLGSNSGIVSKKADIKLGIVIFVPLSSNGNECYGTFSKITDALILSRSLNISEAGCGSISAQRSTGAFTLNAWITISDCISESEAAKT